MSRGHLEESGRVLTCDDVCPRIEVFSVVVKMKSSEVDGGDMKKRNIYRRRKILVWAAREVPETPDNIWEVASKWSFTPGNHIRRHDCK